VREREIVILEPCWHILKAINPLQGRHRKVEPFLEALVTITVLL
jgi:hypothetical protein